MQRIWPIRPDVRQRLLQLSILAVAFIAPIVLCLLISIFALSSPVVPDIVIQPHHDNYTPQALVTLVDKMMTISGAVFVANVWMFNQPLHRKQLPFSLSLMIIQASLAFCSLYAGMRFVYDLAMQIDILPLKFELLRNRLYFQGACLLLQISVICSHAIVYHFHRDRRFSTKVP